MRKFGILMSSSYVCRFACRPNRRSHPAGSENATRATLFGGYSYLRNGSNGFNGWEGQGTFNFNRYLGVTADVSGSSLTPFSFSLLGASAGTYQHINNYLFGPTVTGQLGRSAIFAHALFGEAHSSLGAGVCSDHRRHLHRPDQRQCLRHGLRRRIDIGLTRHFAIRAVQVDYLRTQFNSLDALTTGLSSSLGNRQNSFRYSCGNCVSILTGVCEQGRCSLWA